MMVRCSSSLLLVALAMATTGCDDLQLGGSLGNGEFDYVCGNPGDASCDGVDAIVGFTFDRDVQPVAVGGTFSLVFEGEEDDYDILPAAPNMVTTNAGFFSFVDVGTTDFLAVDVDGKVADFVDMTSAEMDSLGLFYDGSRLQSVALRRFSEEVIAAAPLSQGTVLGGGFQYAWSIEGTGVEIVNAGTANIISVRVEETDASAIVTASTRGFEASILIVAE